MPTRATRRILVSATLTLFGHSAPGAFADDVEFPATAFPIIDAGEVPYYVEAARGALAIDAAVLEYRDRLAQAIQPFDGVGGRYDITLDALAEIDGETTYQVLIDGNVVGTATNSPVGVEFAEQTHVFENVLVPSGALIGVTSSAVSNEQIPENGEFAFARGRWTGLTLTAVDEPTDPATPTERPTSTSTTIDPAPPVDAVDTDASDGDGRSRSGGGAFGPLGVLCVVAVSIGLRRRPIR